MNKLTAAQGRQDARPAFLSRSVALTVTLPGHVAAAVEGECRRTLSSRSEVVADLLAWALPRRLAEDLRHPTSQDVIDIEPAEATA